MMDPLELFFLIGAAFLALLVVVVLFKTAVVVPQRDAYVVQRLGRFSRTLEAGFHFLIPFIDRVAYRHTLKEEVMDVASQTCITKDNIAVEIDGVLYQQVMDAKLASYGIDNYRYATMQLAQTTLRSEIGKIDLDRTFEERDSINARVVAAVDEAASPWGVKVLRYEIKDIIPPATVRDALEKQMRAERERRATVAESEGDRQARINVSEGRKQEMINMSQAEKQRQINEAEGKAREIELIAAATANGIETIGRAIRGEGGMEAVNLRVAEQYVREFGNLAKHGNTLILPANLSEVGSLVASAMAIVRETGPEDRESTS
jgi:regulator of protease activity HflC (stomatin/prohibitin superfamily)